jgi:hypothetical protein
MIHTYEWDSAMLVTSNCVFSDSWKTQFHISQKGNMV